MSKKRKSEANLMEEVDRTMYSTFCVAANSLSHLYSLAVNQHKLAFHAGERHALFTELRRDSNQSSAAQMLFFQHTQKQLRVPSFSRRAPRGVVAMAGSGKAYQAKIRVEVLFSATSDREIDILM
ncbi:hypothetical protein J5N97_022868 [Dioscorea zingiberensis]|uniref:Uncharacterized protein n=1 Tax=Dioscorea zingiberensis TaxID=325984 RepID=A0A9D5HAZ1_9LILI|nr:hypothetical protein J5N97_022868 [Dioscorea zingiberensis]